MSKVALFIDADTVPHSTVSYMLSKLALKGAGEIIVKRAYAGWDSDFSKEWKKVIEDYVLDPIHKFLPENGQSTGSQCLTMAMPVDAMNMMKTDKVETFCFASMTGNFAPLVMQLRADGCNVVGFGDKDAPEALMSMYSIYFILTPELDAEKPSAVKSDKDDSKSYMQDVIFPLVQEMLKISMHDGWADVAALDASAKGSLLPLFNKYGHKSLESVIRKSPYFE